MATLKLKRVQPSKLKLTDMGIKIGVGRMQISSGGGTPLDWSTYWTTRSLFFLDGTIVDVAGTKYFKDKSSAGRDFLITGYDFATDWTVGFPYKSAATISAPAADAVLIADDINNFLYDSGGTPNQIPVVSLFQDIDYEHKIFCKHEAQVVDADLAETYEPRVSYIFMANAVLTGADLTKAQTDFAVPAESGTAYWVTKLGVDATGNGSKATPWATIKKANTTAAAGSLIYVKTGVYDSAAAVDLQRDQTIVGLGRCEFTSSGTYVFDLQETLTLKRFIVNGASTKNNSVLFRGGTTETFTLESVLVKNSNAASFLSISTWVATSLKYCVAIGTTAGATGYYGLTLDTCMVNNVFIIAAASSVPNFYNNRMGIGGVVVYNNSLNFIGNKCSIVTGDYIDYGGTAPTGQRIWTLKKNEFTYSNITNTTYCVDIRGQLYEIDATYNKFYYLSTNAIANVGAFMYVSDVNRSYIEHNRFVCKSKSKFYHVRNHVTGTIVPTTPYKLNYNYCIADALEGSSLALGEELTASNILDNSEVIGNTCIGFRNTYPDDSGSIHQIFVNNGVNIDVKYNYVSHSYFGIIVKAGGDEDVYTEKGVSYNVIYDCAKGIQIKGVNGINVFNNVVYNSATVYENEFEHSFSCIINGVDQRVENVIFKNNISISKRGSVGAMYTLSTAADTSTITYARVYGGRYAVDGMNFADAVTAGYLANSVEGDVVFADVANELFYPATPLAVGEDLGADYDDGLDITTDFGDDNNALTIVTKQQGAAWQLGAYVQ